MRRGMLCVAIPTFNRPFALKDLLNSIYTSILMLTDSERKEISVCIYNNSTLFHDEYKQIISHFSSKLNSRINEFSHTITGIDIGSSNNCFAAIINSRSEYTWFLPDDDLASEDSLKISLQVIRKYQPCMIHGGWINKTIVKNDFNYENNSLKSIHNRISQEIVADKLNHFFEKSVVEAQEHIYRTDYVKLVLKNSEMQSLINEMCPGVFSIYALLGNGPFITLEQSLGVWRSGDRSAWRNRWHRLQLEIWPHCLYLLHNQGLISLEERNKGCDIYHDVFDWMGHRPDVFLGMNLKYRLNPFILIYYHKSKFVEMLKNAPNKIISKLFIKLKIFLK